MKEKSSKREIGEFILQIDTNHVCGEVNAAIFKSAAKPNRALCN